MEKITQYLIQSTVHGSEVRAWEEDIMLPTYEIGEEEKNPIFLEKRVYQGSCGAVYPYPVVEKISDKKADKKYHALFIENEYIKVMVLPELGGRIHMAYDKVKKRHFVYYNQVVKPALVGLTGPWISGGIEFNWPQHHRPSTFLPTDFLIEENADGSKTIWCNEVERMFRTKGMQGFTLYPGKAYIEIKVKIYNRTSFPQAPLVDLARQMLLARPRVAEYEHRHVRGGNQADVAVQLAESGALAFINHFGECLVRHPYLFQCGKQLVFEQRFEDIILRSQFHGMYSRVYLLIVRHHDERMGVALSPHPFQQRGAFPVRQSQVGQHDVILPDGTGDDLPRLCQPVCLHCLVIGILQEIADIIAEQYIVLNHNHSHSFPLPVVPNQLFPFPCPVLSGPPGRTPPPNIPRSPEAA